MCSNVMVNGVVQHCSCPLPPPPPSTGFSGTLLMVFFLLLIQSQFENRVPLKPVLERRGQCCNITLLQMKRLNKVESAIFVSLMCSLLPKDLHSELILSSLHLVFRPVAAVKRLLVHHHGAD